MEGRLSLTIEPGIVQRAKRVARERNTSLSAMVEDVLREAIAGREEGKRGRGEDLPPVRQGPSRFLPGPGLVGVQTASDTLAGSCHSGGGSVG